MNLLSFLLPLLSTALFVFWIIMLVHAISKPIDNKVAWILVIILLNLLGALIYYFAVKRKYIKTSVQPTTPAGPIQP